MTIHGATLVPDEFRNYRGTPTPDVFGLTERDLSQYDRRWLRAVRDETDRAKRSAYDAMQAILAKAGDRDLTRNQQTDFDAHEADIAKLSALRTRLDDAIVDAHDPAGTMSREDSDRLKQTWRTADSVPSHRGATLAPEQRVADYVSARGLGQQSEQGEQLNLGRAVRGMILGDWSDAPAERRAMAEGTNSAGGFLVPTVLSSEIIDLARNAAQVIKAGARTVPMDSQIENVPRQITDPQVAWRLENAAINNSGPTFDLVQFVARSLACVTTVSRELVEDSKRDIHDLLMTVIAKAIGLEVDRVALRGAGVDPEPQGVRNNPNVAVTSLGTNGAAATWDNISGAVQLIRGNNFEPTAALYSPRTAGGLARQKDTQGRYLAPPVDIKDLASLSTSQIPNNLTQGTSNLASEIYVGDWSQLWIGVRTQLQITVLQERYADLGQIGLVAWWRGDVQVAHPAAFNVLTGAL